MARDDDTVVWFDEKELDPPGDSVDFEVSDDQLDREIDAMFAGVVEGAAGAVTGDGFRAAVADRMPGAPSAGQADDGFPRIALDEARQVYVIPVADPVRFLARVRAAYQVLATSEERPLEVRQLMESEFFRAGVLAELTEASALSLFLGAAAYRSTPEQVADTALGQDLATAFKARAAETFKGDRL